MIFLIIF